MDVLIFAVNDGAEVTDVVDNGIDQFGNYFYLMLLVMDLS